MTSREQVQQFLAAIFNDGNGYMAITRVPVDGGTSQWQDLSTSYYAVREGRPTDVADLVPADEWYLVPSLLSKQDRRKEAVLHASTLWVDFDTEINPYDLSPSPSIIVQTSPARYHCYWLLDEPATLVNLEYHNRRLAYAYTGGDHSGWDAGQLLRLPCGVNAKYSPAFEVRLLRCEPDRRYSLDAFSHLPEHPQILIDTNPTAFNLPNVPVDRDTLLTKLQDRITVKLQLMLRKQQPDRSRALWWVYNECFRLGLSREETYWLVRGTPNDKFAHLRYNADQSLWRDIVAGFAQAEAGNHDRGILDTMQAIRNDRASQADKMDKMGRVLTMDMAKHGLFLQSTNPTSFYYFDNVDGRLFEVDPRSPQLRKLFLDRYAINAGGSEFAQLFEHVMSRCQDDAPINVYKTAYYDLQSNLLYVNRFDNHMYRVGAKEIELLRNGEDGVLFVNPPGATPWKIRQPQAKNLWARHVFSSANVVEQAGVDVPTVHHALWTWLCALFFRELLPVKPILFMHGEAGSGKTSVFKGISAILQGVSAGIADLPEEDDGFNLQVASNDMVFFDNVDSWKPWLPDKLAMTSTSYSFERRKLYTDNFIMRYTVSCFIGLTARTPKFLRDDVAERIIPIYVVPFAGQLANERQIVERWNHYRGELWGELLEYLQRIVAWMGHNGVPSYSGNFRQADFAALLSVTCALSEREMEPVLRFIKFNQAKEAIDDDPMMSALRQWLERPDNPGKEVTAAQLHSALGFTPGGAEFTKKVPTPRGMAIKLSQMEKFLATAGIEMERVGSSSPRYKFSLR